jgi:hypothetical protein
MTTGFTPGQKAIVLFRDFKKCPICHEEATEVNHRANRGSGGYKAGNVLSNACAICSTCNGLIESNADMAILARARGVKLFRDDIPSVVAYLHPYYNMWCLLDDIGDYRFIDTPTVA